MIDTFRSFIWERESRIFFLISCYIFLDIALFGLDVARLVFGPLHRFCHRSLSTGAYYGKRKGELVGIYPEQEKSTNAKLVKESNHYKEALQDAQ